MGGAGQRKGDRIGGGYRERERIDSRNIPRFREMLSLGLLVKSEFQIRFFKALFSSES